jgi:hypothetical protein
VANGRVGLHVVLGDRTRLAKARGVDDSIRVRFVSMLHLLKPALFIGTTRFIKWRM